MPKVEDLEIGISPLTGSIFVGTVTKDGKGWKQKKDVTSQFISVMLSKFPVGFHTITSNGKQFLKLKLKKLRKHYEAT